MPINVRVWVASPAGLGFQLVKLVRVWSVKSRTWPNLAWLVRAFGGARLAAGFLLARRPPTHLRANSKPAASRAPPKALTCQARIGQVRLVTIHRRTSLTHWNPSPAGLASQTRTCMGTFSGEIYPSLAPESSSRRRTCEPDSYVYGQLYGGVQDF